MRYFVSIIILFTSSCGAGLYDLPDPKPKAEWKKVNLTPSAEELSDEKLYQGARLKILEIYGLLNDQNFEAVNENLSAETQDFLKFGTQGSVAEVLSNEKLNLANGTLVTFKPVSILLAEDVTRLTDSVDGIEENETPTRKEIFAEQSDGRFKRIVMIRQGDSWVLHRTRISELIQPQ